MKARGKYKCESFVGGQEALNQTLNLWRLGSAEQQAINFAQLE